MKVAGIGTLDDALRELQGLRRPGHGRAARATLYSLPLAPIQLRRVDRRSPSASGSDEARLTPAQIERHDFPKGAEGPRRAGGARLPPPRGRRVRRGEPAARRPREPAPASSVAVPTSSNSWSGGAGGDCAPCVRPRSRRRRWRNGRVRRRRGSSSRRSRRSRRACAPSSVEAGEQGLRARLVETARGGDGRWSPRPGRSDAACCRTEPRSDDAAQYIDQLREDRDRFAEAYLAVRDRWPMRTRSSRASAPVARSRPVTADAGPPISYPPDPEAAPDHPCRAAVQCRGISSTPRRSAPEPPPWVQRESSKPEREPPSTPTSGDEASARDRYRSRRAARPTRPGARATTATSRAAAGAGSGTRGGEPSTAPEPETDAAPEAERAPEPVPEPEPVAEREPEPVSPAASEPANDVDALFERIRGMRGETVEEPRIDFDDAGSERRRWRSRSRGERGGRGRPRRVGARTTPGGDRRRPRAAGAARRAPHSDRPRARPALQARPAERAERDPRRAAAPSAAARPRKSSCRRSPNR